MHTVRHFTHEKCKDSNETQVLSRKVRNGFEERLLKNGRKILAITLMLFASITQSFADRAHNSTKSRGQSAERSSFAIPTTLSATNPAQRSAEIDAIAARFNDAAPKMSEIERKTAIEALRSLFQNAKNAGIALPVSDVAQTLFWSWETKDALPSPDFSRSLALLAQSSTAVPANIAVLLKALSEGKTENINARDRESLRQWALKTTEPKSLQSKLAFLIAALDGRDDPSAILRLVPSLSARELERERAAYRTASNETQKAVAAVIEQFVLRGRTLPGSVRSDLMGLPAAEIVNVARSLESKQSSTESLSWDALLSAKPIAERAALALQPLTRRSSVKYPSDTHEVSRQLNNRFQHLFEKGYETITDYDHPFKEPPEVKNVRPFLRRGMSVHAATGFSELQMNTVRNARQWLLDAIQMNPYYAEELATTVHMIDGSGTGRPVPGGVESEKWIAQELAARKAASARALALEEKAYAFAQTQKRGLSSEQRIAILTAKPEDLDRFERVEKHVATLRPDLLPALWQQPLTKERIAELYDYWGEFKLTGNADKDKQLLTNALSEFSSNPHLTYDHVASILGNHFKEHEGYSLAEDFKARGLYGVLTPADRTLILRHLKGDLAQGGKQPAVQARARPSAVDESKRLTGAALQSMTWDELNAERQRISERATERGISPEDREIFQAQADALDRRLREVALARNRERVESPLRGFYGVAPAELGARYRHGDPNMRKHVFFRGGDGSVAIYGKDLAEAQALAKLPYHKLHAYLRQLNSLILDRGMDPATNQFREPVTKEVSDWLHRSAYLREEMFKRVEIDSRPFFKLSEADRTYGLNSVERAFKTFPVEDQLNILAYAMNDADTQWSHPRIEAWLAQRGVEILAPERTKSLAIPLAEAIKDPSKVEWDKLSPAAINKIFADTDYRHAADLARYWNFRLTEESLATPPRDIRTWAALNFSANLLLKTKQKQAVEDAEVLALQWQRQSPTWVPYATSPQADQALLNSVAALEPIGTKLFSTRDSYKKDILEQLRYPPHWRQALQAARNAIQQAGEDAAAKELGQKRLHSILSMNSGVLANEWELYRTGHRERLTPEESVQIVDSYLSRPEDTSTPIPVTGNQRVLILEGDSFKMSTAIESMTRAYMQQMLAADGRDREGLRRVAFGFGVNGDADDKTKQDALWALELERQDLLKVYAAADSDQSGFLTDLYLDHSKIVRSKPQQQELTKQGLEQVLKAIDQSLTFNNPAMLAFGDHASGVNHVAAEARAYNRASTETRKQVLKLAHQATELGVGLPASARAALFSLTPTLRNWAEKALASKDVPDQLKLMFLHSPSPLTFLALANEQPGFGLDLAAATARLFPDMPSELYLPTKLEGPSRRKVREWILAKLEQLRKPSSDPIEFTNPQAAEHLGHLLFVIDQWGNRKRGFARRPRPGLLELELKTLTPQESLAGLRAENKARIQASARALKALDDLEDDLSAHEATLPLPGRLSILRPGFANADFDALDRVRDRIAAMRKYGEPEAIQANIDAFETVAQGLTPASIKSLTEKWDNRSSVGFAKFAERATEFDLRETIFSEFDPKHGKPDDLKSHLSAKGKAAYAEWIERKIRAAKERAIQAGQDPEKVDKSAIESEEHFSILSLLASRLANTGKAIPTTLISDPDSRTYMEEEAKLRQEIAQATFDFGVDVNRRKDKPVVEMSGGEGEPAQKIPLRTGNILSDSHHAQMLKEYQARLQKRSREVFTDAERTVQSHAYGTRAAAESINGQLEILNSKRDTIEKQMKQILARPGGEKASADLKEALELLDKSKAELEAAQKQLTELAKSSEEMLKAVLKQEAEVEADHNQELFEAKTKLENDRTRDLDALVEAFLQEKLQDPAFKTLKKRFEQDPDGVRMELRGSFLGNADLISEAEEIAEALQVSGKPRADISQMNETERKIIASYLARAASRGDGSALPLKGAMHYLQTSLNSAAAKQAQKDAAARILLPDVSKYAKWDGHMRFDFANGPLWELNDPQTQEAFAQKMQKIGNELLGGLDVWQEQKDAWLGEYFKQGSPKRLVPKDSELAIEIRESKVKTPEGKEISKYDFVFHPLKDQSDRGTALVKQLTDSFTEYNTHKTEAMKEANAHAWEKEHWNGALNKRLGDVTNLLNKRIPEALDQLEQLGDTPVITADGSAYPARLLAQKLRGELNFSLHPDLRMLASQVDGEVYAKARFYRDTAIALGADAALTLIGKPPTAVFTAGAQVSRTALWGYRAWGLATRVTPLIKKGYKMALFNQGASNLVAQVRTANQYGWAPLLEHNGIQADWLKTSWTNGWGDKSYREEMARKGVKPPAHFDQDGDGKVDFEQTGSFPWAQMRYAELTPGVERSMLLMPLARPLQSKLAQYGFGRFIGEPLGMGLTNYGISRLWTGDSHDVALRTSIDMAVFAAPFDDVAAKYGGAMNGATGRAYLFALAANMGADFIMGAYQHNKGISARTNPDTGKFEGGYQVSGPAVETTLDAALVSMWEGLPMSIMAAKNSRDKARNDAIRAEMSKGVPLPTVLTKFNIKPKNLKQELSSAMGEGTMGEWSDWNKQNLHVLHDSGAATAGLTTAQFKAATEAFMRGDDIQMDTLRDFRISRRKYWTLQEAMPILLRLAPPP